jgi:hypothetical protein
MHFSVGNGTCWLIVILFVWQSVVDSVIPPDVERLAMRLPFIWGGEQIISPTGAAFQLLLQPFHSIRYPWIVTALQGFIH